MDKQLEHTPTPWYVDYSQCGPEEIITTSSDQKIAQIGERSIRQGTPKGNRDFILRACNNHEYLVGSIRLLLDAIDGEGEHEHDPDDCDVCYAVDDAKRQLVKVGRAWTP